MYEMKMTRIRGRKASVAAVVDRVPLAAMAAVGVVAVAVASLLPTVVVLFNVVSPQQVHGYVPVSVTSVSSSIVSHRRLQRHLPLLLTAIEDDSAENNGYGKGEDRRQWMKRMATNAAAAAFSFSSTTSSAVAATSTASTGAASQYVVPTPAFTKDVSWPLGKVAFSLLPLAGTSTRRATVEECLVEDTIWTHDQIQGVVNVNVPVRQTVIRLSKESGGGLWVLNPVAPTPQLLEMMDRLIETYGPVRHIVLGTVALEHKATFGAFCQQYKDATCWIQPGQWSFPVDLPIDTLGVTQKGPRLREIPVAGKKPTSSLYRTATERYGEQPEWIKDLEFEVLGPFPFKSVGAFSETAFYHKSTKSLLVTDTVVSVTDTPPPIIQEDPRAMLFHARDNITEIVEDTPLNRRRGWRRMVQFGLVFFPSQINVVPTGEAIKEAFQIDKSMSNLGDGAVPFNVYPWTWNGNDDERNFNMISQNGKLFTPPILTKLILDREVEGTLEWVDRVVTRFPNMKRVIPCHLNNNVQATKDDFYHAFDPLRSNPSKLIPQRALAEDLALLQKASDLLTKLNVVGPSSVCDGEAARQVGRFASKSLTR
mmetsp:Transcript_11419/g.27263  ORF Transcript_11419/g.27263 Transcript_11419/m.27263 type:complete len:594 (+) Transcript_11419:41-1822(+)